MSKRNFLIIHGSYGSPQGNWFPWLKNKLEKDGHTVFAPQFPCPKSNAPEDGTHDIQKWFETVGSYLKYLDRESIIIAHSRGCVFLFHLLQRMESPIHAAFFVGPFLYHWLRKDWTAIENDERYPFDWMKIRHAASHRIVYQSGNDEISVSEGKEIADNLDAEFVLVENAGHFNTESDPKYKKFEVLLERVQKIL